jgi:hypothetical protein
MRKVFPCHVVTFCVCREEKVFKKVLSLIVISFFAVYLTSCAKTVKIPLGTWVSNIPGNGTGSLIIRKVDPKSISFYMEYERMEVFRVIEGTAVLEDHVWVFDLDKAPVQNAAPGERKGAFFQKAGFKIRFSVNGSDGKVESIAVSGDNDGAFFQGKYVFLNASLERPKAAVNVIDGYYRKTGKTLDLDIYLNAGILSERQLVNGAVTGGRQIGPFTFVGSEMVVTVADAEGTQKNERWMVVDDTTLRDPSGSEYTYYVP